MSVPSLNEARDILGSLEAAVDRGDREYVGTMAARLPRRLSGLYPDTAVATWRQEVLILARHSAAYANGSTPDAVLLELSIADGVLRGLERDHEPGAMVWGEAVKRENAEHAARLLMLQTEVELRRASRRSRRTHTLEDLSRDMRANGIAL